VLGAPDTHSESAHDMFIADRGSVNIH
jgi:hypothetical protein